MILLFVIAAVAILYYVTPNVKQPRFRWISVGAGTAILIWVVGVGCLFGFYVANFASYNKTYGALAGVIVFLLWLWITNLALLFGAELDAELERGRQLQAGLPAEQELQLPPKDTRVVEKSEAAEKKDIKMRQAAAADPGPRRVAHTHGRDSSDPRHRHRGGRPRLRDGGGHSRAQRHAGVLRDGQGRGRRATWSRCGERSASGSSGEPGYRFVELADPPRAKDTDYRQAVAEWHSARAAVWADAIERELAPDGVGAFLAWGDPSLYDSTLRILDAVAQHVEIDYDVIPGITAIQALTARHRIPLNDIGEPVLITTGTTAGGGRVDGQRGGHARRRLRVPVLPAGYPNLVGRLPGHTRRAAGVGHRRRGRRTDREAAGRGARRHGWIMDTYLRSP